jgi:predicted DNA-binding transcriptional regulator AlpA
MGAAEAARFCNYSLPHFRRLYRSGQAPPPVRLTERKLGWRRRVLINWIASREKQYAA